MLNLPKKGKRGLIHRSSTIRTSFKFLNAKDLVSVSHSGNDHHFSSSTQVQKDLASLDAISECPNEYHPGVNASYTPPLEKTESKRKKEKAKGIGFRLDCSPLKPLY